MLSQYGGNQAGGDGNLAEQSVAAATAVVGYDLLTNDPLRQSEATRRIRKAGLAGSAAALDTKVELKVGNTTVATLFNVSTGAVLTDAHMRGVGARVPAGVEVRAVVTDAPATNPINIVVEFA